MDGSNATTSKTTTSDNNDIIHHGQLTAFSLLDDDIKGKVTEPMVMKALALADDRYIADIDGIQLSVNRKMLEVTFKSTLAADALMANGIFIGGNVQRTIQFQPKPIPTIHVSIQGFPLEAPMADLHAALADHGTIVGSFNIIKKMYEKGFPIRLRNGTRVVQFSSLVVPIPRNINLMGRQCIAIYTNQQSHHQAYAEEERQRLEKEKEAELQRIAEEQEAREEEDKRKKEAETKKRQAEEARIRHLEEQKKIEKELKEQEENQKRAEIAVAAAMNNVTAVTAVLEPPSGNTNGHDNGDVMDGIESVEMRKRKSDITHSDSENANKKPMEKKSKDSENGKDTDNADDADDENSLLSGDDGSGKLTIITSDEEEALKDKVPTDAAMVNEIIKISTSSDMKQYTEKNTNWLHQLFMRFWKSTDNQVNESKLKSAIKVLSPYIDEDKTAFIVARFLVELKGDKAVEEVTKTNGYGESTISFVSNYDIISETEPYVHIIGDVLASAKDILHMDNLSK